MVTGGPFPAQYQTLWKGFPSNQGLTGEGGWIDLNSSLNWLEMGLSWSEQVAELTCSSGDTAVDNLMEAEIINAPICYRKLLQQLKISLTPDGRSEQVTERTCRCNKCSCLLDLYWGNLFEKEINSDEPLTQLNLCEYSSGFKWSVSSTLPKSTVHAESHRGPLQSGTWQGKSSGGAVTYSERVVWLRSYRGLCQSYRGVVQQYRHPSRILRKLSGSGPWAFEVEANLGFL